LLLVKDESKVSVDGGGSGALAEWEGGGNGLATVDDDEDDESEDVDEDDDKQQDNEAKLQSTARQLFTQFFCGCCWVWWLIICYFKQKYFFSKFIKSIKI